MFLYFLLALNDINRGDTESVRSPERLEQLFRDYDRLQQKGVGVTDELRALERTIDDVGGQRYCSRSRLFWYTDLEQAKTVAQATGQPILSLRMLGKLTEELSCANSRFFRTTLYANAEISALLRERFVLHWESIRPVPTVTIDFGDGRKLVQTVTGNSVHYVLTPQGALIDALPGLFGPTRFLSLLKQADATAQQLASASPDQHQNVLQSYHQACLDRIAHDWNKDLQLIALRKGHGQIVRQLRDAEQCPTLVDAVSSADLETRTTDEGWKELAALHITDAALDQSSLNLIRAENPEATPKAEKAGLRAMSKGPVETPLLHMLRGLRQTIAEDSIRNEYLLHRTIHEWCVAGQTPPTLPELNEKVYTELFLTPSSDPWLGLVTTNAYTGLTNGGVVQKSP